MPIGTRHANPELHRSAGTLCRNHDDDDENGAVEGKIMQQKIYKRGKYNAERKETKIQCVCRERERGAMRHFSVPDTRL